jgi:Fanconi anemia group M protein
MSQIKLDSSLFPKKEEKSTNGNGGINVTPSNGKPTEGQDKENTAFCKMYVDVHEPSDIVEMLRSDKGIYVEIKALEAGDYAFSSIGIERKTLQDFYNSIVHGDKHIWKQIFKLKYAFARPLLIIERWDESFFTSQKIKNTVDGAIASIFLMGVSILTIPGRGQNSGNFVDILAFLFYSSDKKALSMRPVPEKTKSPKKKDVLSDVLVMIPFIGRKTANELANHANSIEEICQMKDEDLRKKAPGIRKDGLAAIRWVLNGKEWEKARKENEVKEK